MFDRSEEKQEERKVQLQELLENRDAFGKFIPLLKAVQGVGTFPISEKTLKESLTSCEDSNGHKAYTHKPKRLGELRLRTKD